VKHPVKTLAALAILSAVAPSAYAVSIKDDVLSLTPGIRIQTRAQMSDATTGSIGAGTTNAPGAVVGDEYRVQGGIGGAVNDPLDFSMRRARLYMSFKYGSNWKGQFAINADKVDESGTASASRGIVLRYAWLERTFDLGDGMNHAITFGLNKPYQNPSDAGMSSSRALLPNDNAASAYLAPRGVGVGYRFNHPMFLIAADLQNNTAAKDTSTALSADQDEGFYYGVRAEFSFAPEWFIKKRAESFVGKEGQGLNIGLSYSANTDAVAAASTSSLSAYGVDVMFWMNGLSAYAEYRAGTTETDAYVGASAADVDAEFIVLQLAYAFPIGEEVLEPALRYQIIDSNTDADQVVNFGSNAETGAAGTQIDIGLNYYLSGHDNKLQLAVSLWESEEGEGDATIIRLQHQINF